jgi:hypothetical protein
MGGENEALDLKAERRCEMHCVEPSQQVAFREFPGLTCHRTGDLNDVRRLEHAIEPSDRNAR